MSTCAMAWSAAVLLSTLHFCRVCLQCTAMGLSTAPAILCTERTARPSPAASPHGDAAGPKYAPLRWWHGGQRAPKQRRPLGLDGTSNRSGHA